MINVMGSGIANRKPDDEQADMAAILAGSYCSYPGVLSKFISVPQTTAETVNLSLPVPVGRNRVVQVLGVIFPGGCQGDPEDHLDSVSNDSSGTIKGIFEIGRAIVDTFGNVTVTIPNDYNSASPREVTCEGRNRMVDCSKHLTDSPFAAGSGTEKDPYAVCTTSQLANVNTARSAHYFVGDDITLSGEWTPLGSTSPGPFSGTFDGRGFQISGMTITTNGNERGLFGRNDGVIKNVKVSGTISVASTYTKIGILAGANYGTILQCQSTGSASGTPSVGVVGGLVGYSAGGSISRSSSSATADGGTFIGGLVGGAYADISPATTIDRCFSEGVVTGNGAFVGGFAGILHGATVKDSYVKLSTALSGTGSVGGFVGIIQNSASILRSFVYGISNAVPSGVPFNNAFVGNFSPGGTYQNVYAQNDLASGPDNGDSGTPLTPPQMRDTAAFSSNFAGFDFQSVWLPPDGSNPPTLR